MAELQADVDRQIYISVGKEDGVQLRKMFSRLRTHADMMCQLPWMLRCSSAEAVEGQFAASSRMNLGASKC